MKVTEYGELIELLYVRRALETEAARQAAISARAEDIAVLMRSVEDHRDTVEQNRDPTEPALEFHAVVADISHNKFICPILNMLIYEEKKIEAVMETLVTRERGRVYVKEHEQIAQAICDHDGEKAAQFMYAHIDELCKAVEISNYVCTFEAVKHCSIAVSVFVIWAALTILHARQRGKEQDLED